MHAVSLGVLALTRALETGQPFAAEMQVGGRARAMGEAGEAGLRVWQQFPEAEGVGARECQGAP